MIQVFVMKQSYNIGRAHTKSKKTTGRNRKTTLATMCKNINCKGHMRQN